MTANVSPIFPEALLVGVAAIATANANRDGTGTIGTVASAGTDGSRIDKVAIKATGTTTAGMVRIYLHNGATAFLIAEQTIAAITPSATVKSEEYTLSSAPFPLYMPTGWSLRASTERAENFNVFAFGGDY